MASPLDTLTAAASAPVLADVIRSQIAELTRRGMLAEARDLAACAARDPSNLAPCVAYGAQLLARPAFAAVASSTSKGSTMTPTPAALAALSRAAARPDLTATRAALSRVPASVRDFAAVVARANAIKAAEKRSRLMKIGAVIVGGLALVYFARRRAR